MRKLVYLFAPATLALLGLVACGDDSSAGDPGQNIDSGLPDSNGPQVDGNLPDAGPDAPVPQVKVTVKDSTGPRSNVRIVFHDANGAVLDTKVTGADGTVARTGAAPAMVSALLARGNQHHIVTWTGVELGDDLQVRDVEQNEEPLGLYNVSVPNLDPAAGWYEMSGPCSNTTNYGTAAALPMYASCSRAQNAVLVLARKTDGTVTGHAFKKGNAPVTAGGTLAITTGSFAPPTSVALDITNMDGAVSYDEHLLEIANGAGFESRWGKQEGTTTTFPTATGFAEALQATAAFNDGSTNRTITKRVAPTNSVSLDYATLLPKLTEITTNATDPRRAEISWAAAGSTADADGALVQFGFHGPEEDATYLWTFVVAPSATSVKAPAMPAEAESFLPPSTDSGVELELYQPSVMFVEADVLPNYAAFRQQQGTLVGLARDGFGGFTFPTVPTNGTYKTTSYTLNPR